MLQKLRGELEDIIACTLELAAAVPFGRRRDDRGLFGLFDPSVSQSLAAAKYHARLTHWTAAVSSIIRRRTPLPTDDFKRAASELAECVNLSFTADARMPESWWRNEFSGRVGARAAELRLILDKVAEVYDAFREPRAAQLDTFLLRISVEDDSQWRITGTSRRGSTAEVVGRPFASAFLGEFRDRWCHAGPTAGAEHLDWLTEFGHDLWRAVLGGEAGKLLGAEPSRIVLSLPPDESLSDIPWELLHDGNMFLSLSQRTPVIRALSATAHQPPQPSPPWRVLMTVSTPPSLDYVNAEEELEALDRTLAPLTTFGDVQVDVTRDGTMNTVRRMLRNAGETGRPYDVWHFIGHGGYDAIVRNGTLAMTAGDNAYAAGRRHLAALFADHPELRLVVLNACMTARPGSAVRTFIEDGVPAVIGMQFEVTNDAAVTFAEELYGSLVVGLPIESAVTAARRAVFFQPNTTEWLAPVLFLTTAV